MIIYKFKIILNCKNNLSFFHILIAKIAELLIETSYFHLTKNLD